ncbi:c-type cytochrome [Haloferula chungangensis]|uniref:C-type cytochrome n=1 Tax=Haloferula chungangensis TaxID=1048331 RepID=A0ABW2L6H8_9BACT
MRHVSRLTLSSLLLIGTVFSADPEAPSTAQKTLEKTDQFEVPEGFIVEQMYQVPEEFGSWVALTKMANGDLAAADQYGGIYRVIHEEGATRAERLEIALEGAHAILWHGDSLYVTVSEGDRDKKGIYRARDLDGNGSFEKIDKLRAHQGGGEHSAHSLVPSPDGKWIYLIAGNMTPLLEFDQSLMPRVWAEDQLLPRNPDGRGHARNIMAPGGWIARFQPDGSQWELVAAGFRNPFDMAFNEDGELFAYDADMEWDLGMPWYRPTRLNHVIPGAEFGWRNGTGKWPKYYEDSLGAVVEFGPGSPTGVVSGKGTAFPAKYQRAIFCFDWTFATIYAAHLTPDGASYRGEREEFFTASGFPLTDAVVGDDGAMYFATGGRRTASALWRIRYAGAEDVSPVAPPTRKHVIASDSEKLGSKDRVERFASRTALENAGADAVRAAKAGTAMAKINRAIALSRVGGKEDRSEIFHALIDLNWAQLNVVEKLAWLRACDLMFIRLGEPSAEERSRILTKIDASFPTEESRVNAELCRLLCYLQAPKIVERTLQQMAEPDSTQLPDWARLVTRNKGYGSTLAKTLRDAPPVEDLHFAYCLRVVKGPWTKGQRRQLMEWYAMVEGKEGGKSYALFLERMRTDTLDNATEDERKMIESWGLKVVRSPFANLPVAQGPGRDWTIEEVVEVADNLEGADKKNGKKMFQAALCMACHRVGSEGGSAGPDLTTVSGRFSAEDLATAIIEPSKEVSDQYEFSLITRKDGSTVYGQVLDEKDLVLIVATSALDLTQTIEIERGEVAKIEPSAISPMPPGLITSLNKKELRDMLAWLLQK